MSTTFVSAFFNLAKIENNSKRRPVSIYLNYSIKLLKMDINLFFFGDEETCIYVYNKRKEFSLLEKTFIYVIDFNSLPYNIHLNNIKQIYSTNGLFGSTEEELAAHWTPTYLTCIWSKPYLLNKAALLNIFNSSHFYWIDFGYFKLEKDYGNCMNDLSIEHFKTIEQYPPPNNKIRINVLTKPNYELINNPFEFYKTDRYYCAGGLFGGSALSIKNFLDMFETEMKYMMSLERISGEENIFSRVVFCNPNSFDISISMYALLLKNFCYTDSLVFRNLLFVNYFRKLENHLFETQVCEKILLGFYLKKYNLTNEDLMNIYNSVLISSYYVDYQLYKKYVEEIKSFLQQNNLTASDLMISNMRF